MLIFTQVTNINDIQETKEIVQYIVEFHTAPSVHTKTIERGGELVECDSSFWELSGLAAISAPSAVADSMVRRGWSRARLFHMKREDDGRAGSSYGQTK